MNHQLAQIAQRVTLFFTTALLVVSMPVSAQGFGSNSNNNYVTVYQDCDYRGSARNIPVGDYQDMRAVQMKNDSISSIRVPAGLELTIYEHEQYGGFSASVQQDERCLDTGWNDQISSLKVHAAGNSGLLGGNDGYYSDYQVDGNTVERVEFAGTVLEKNAERQWSLTNRNGQSSNFRQLSKNNNAVYLEGIRNGQKIRIDLFTNDVTILARNGEQASYKIARSQRRNENYRADRKIKTNQAAVSQQPGVASVRGQCFNFTAYTNGGEGGLRFRGHKELDFLKLSKRPYNGRLCHSGELVFEISKRALTTDVVLEIQGQKFRFAPNAQYDELRNSWYRNLMKVNVGR